MSGIADTVMWLIPDEQSLRGLHVARLTIEMPIEVYPRKTDGGLELDGNAPSQSLRTGFMPVFHRVRVTIEAEPARSAGAPVGEP